MKIFCSILIIIVSMLSAAAQSESQKGNASTLQILEKKWSSRVFNPLLIDDPFQANNDIRQAQLDEIQYMRQSQIRAKMGLPPESKPTRSSSPKNDRNDRSDDLRIYTYELKVKNSGDKEIESLIWEYVFLDADTNQEIGRRQFVSRINLQPEKTKNVVVQSGISPTPTINVRDMKKNPAKFAEQIVIQSIIYKDGSAWVAPTK